MKTYSLLKRAEADKDGNAASQAYQTLHHVFVQKELLKQENQGLTKALKANKRKRKRKKTLPLSPGDPNLAGGAVFWDGAAKERADARLKAKEQEDAAAEVAKVNRKKT